MRLRRERMRIPLSDSDLKSANSEEELRSKAAIPDVPLEYLRFVKQEDGAWKPAAGSFVGWPDNLAEFKMLDPCCGSGHFLAAVFLMLVPMRMELEGLSIQEAVDMVLRDNLHGLEIDLRCTEIAAFNLALSAFVLRARAGCIRMQTHIDRNRNYVAQSGHQAGDERS